jgi:hypothetical protein
MDYTELLKTLGLDKEIRITIIKPVRNGDIFKEGILAGIKPGKHTGGWTYTKAGKTFIASNSIYIKPRVLVAYPTSIIYGKPKGQVTDWVDVDNCIFEIQP